MVESTDNVEISKINKIDLFDFVNNSKPVIIDQFNPTLDSFHFTNTTNLGAVFSRFIPLEGGGCALQVFQAPPESESEAAVKTNYIILKNVTGDLGQLLNSTGLSEVFYDPQTVDVIHASYAEELENLGVEPSVKVTHDKATLFNGNLSSRAKAALSLTGLMAIGVPGMMGQAPADIGTTDFGQGFDPDNGDGLDHVNATFSTYAPEADHTISVDADGAAANTPDVADAFTISLDDAAALRTRATDDVIQNELGNDTVPVDVSISPPGSSATTLRAYAAEYGDALERAYRSTQNITTARTQTMDQGILLLQYLAANYKVLGKAAGTKPILDLVAQHAGGAHVMLTELQDLQNAAATGDTSLDARFKSQAKTYPHYFNPSVLAGKQGTVIMGSSNTAGATTGNLSVQDAKDNLFNAYIKQFDLEAVGDKSSQNYQNARREVANAKQVLMQHKGLAGQSTSPIIISIEKDAESAVEQANGNRVDVGPPNNTVTNSTQITGTSVGSNGSYTLKARKNETFIVNPGDTGTRFEKGSMGKDLFYDPPGTNFREFVAGSGEGDFVIYYYNDRGTRIADIAFVGATSDAMNKLKNSNTHTSINWAGIGQIAIKNGKDVLLRGKPAIEGAADIVVDGSKEVSAQTNTNTQTTEALYEAFINDVQLSLRPHPSATHRAPLLNETEAQERINLLQSRGDVDLDQWQNDPNSAAPKSWSEAGLNEEVKRAGFAAKEYERRVAAAKTDPQQIG